MGKRSGQKVPGQHVEGKYNRDGEHRPAYDAARQLQHQQVRHRAEEQIRRRQRIHQRPAVQDAVELADEVDSGRHRKRRRRQIEPARPFAKLAPIRPRAGKRQRHHPEEKYRPVQQRVHGAEQHGPDLEEREQHGCPQQGLPQKFSLCLWNCFRCRGWSLSHGQLG